MLSTILLVLAAVVVLFALVVTMQPSEMRITRSAVMAASPATVFAQVNDLHKWDAWSPWAKLDPNAKTTFEGAASGTGAVMRWDSANNNIGAGSMTITESHPSDRVMLQLDFLRPMRGTNTTEFTFAPQEGQTLVTWTMIGHSGFVQKAMALVFNCEKMVGGQFERGLASLKSVVETNTK